MGTVRDLVPPFAQIALLPVEERVACRNEWVAAIGSIEASVRGSGLSPGQQTALYHLRRGVATVDRLAAANNGDPSPGAVFEPARPVHTFKSAIQSHKAVNRLLGLCEHEHRVIGEWLANTQEPDPRVVSAYELVERALRDGGGPAADKAGDE